MTGMDMLRASLTQEQLDERVYADLVKGNEEMARAWIAFIKDLEKRIRE